MGRLADSLGNAGMNAGAAVVARLKRTPEIKTDPELAGMFAVNPEILAAIIKSMRESGYDKSQPVVLWKEREVVVDGHTRLQAAAEAGISEIPVAEKEFASLADAKLYAYRRQAERRNLTPAEILAAAVELQPKDSRDGTGRASELLAKTLGVSPSTVKHAQTVAREAPPEIIDEVKMNNMTIDKAYRLTKGKPDRQSKAKPATDLETPGFGYEELQIPETTTLSTDPLTEPDFEDLARLELWIHRENLNIPAGNDPRLKAARSMLNSLSGFAVPEVFVADMSVLLQAMFQTKLNGQAAPDSAGAEHEE
jgi:ParB family chromosome partitioning protein